MLLPFFVILIVRRLQGRTGRLAWASGFASGIAILLVNRRRLNLQRLRSATFEMVLHAMFDERTANFFARLPEAVNKLHVKLGELEDLGLDEEAATEKSKTKALRRLYDLSSSGRRKPYSEARKAYSGPTAATTELQEATRLLAFAEATYENSDIVRRTCARYNHEVLFSEETSAPGAPAHFLSFDSKRKEAILSIRGTKTLQDVLTDLLQDIDEFQVEDDKKSYAHAGMLASAEHVLWRVKPVLRDLLCPQGYSLTVTGHSLGAGTAALVTRLLIRESRNWKLAPASVRCICFAPPPIMDAPTALASDSIITSYVCNDDCVPRMSLQNIGRLNLLAQGKGVEEVVEVGAGRQDALAKSVNIPDLMVPGQVIVLHKVKDGPAPAEDVLEDRDASSEPATSKPAGEWTAEVADGTLPEINYLELSPASVAEHMAPVYREAIAAFLDAQGADIGVPPRAEEDFPTWLARAEASTA